MSETQVRSFLGGDLHQHEAVLAWRRIDPHYATPARLETLKFKNKTAAYRLAAAAPEGRAVIAKKCQTVTGRIESIIYREVLPRMGIPVLRCYGFSEEPNREMCWLFLEDAQGGPYSPESAEHRALAGRWLGQAHRAVLPPEWVGQLPDRSLGHYHELLGDCRGELERHLRLNGALDANGAAVFESVLRHCDRIESRWNQVEAMCGNMPPALVQGDFVVKNMRVRVGPNGPSLLVYDWEFSGWGLPGTDLAQRIGAVACPDLDVYGDTVRQRHPDLGTEVIRGVAQCGNLMRLLNDIDWELRLLEIGSAPHLVKPVANLRSYGVRLVNVLNTMKWF